MRTSTRVAILSALVPWLAGCSSLQTRTFWAVTHDPELVQVPAVEADAEVELGASMVAKTYRRVVPAIRLATAAWLEGTLDMAPYSAEVPRGPLVEAGRDSAGTYYEAPSGIRFRQNGDSRSPRGGMYVPEGSRVATAVWVGTNDPRFALAEEYPGGLKFETTTVERFTEGSFRRELVYSGVSENTITLVYREFLNDTARPAFTQELKYDLAKGDVIGYRGARFRVLAVTNTSIRYKVLKPLE